ncbi:MAG: polyprenyl synthetase family protein [Desulfovibrio sp.]|nr:polyprenyl synthetase family protein [Desulfovibrio sp.]
MAYLLLKTRLALELPRINAALEEAEHTLPAPVQPVAHHIFNSGGKRIRPLLLVLVARLLGCQGDNVYRLAVTLEMLHAATLLHDDVIDDAATRRGRPAAHTLFDQTQTILAGDALLACGNALVADFQNTALSRSFSQATSETCAGEILEIAAQRDPELSLEQYLAIISGKTAKLISCACEMGALLAEASAQQVAAAAAFGEHIGIAFQLVDDAIDFAEEGVTGKPSFGDLREGKMTYPLRCYRQNLDSDARAHFDEQFRSAAFSPEACRAIAESVRRLGYDRSTRDFADSYLQQAEDNLMDLPDGKERTLLREMAAFVRERTK